MHAGNWGPRPAQHASKYNKVNLCTYYTVNYKWKNPLFMCTVPLFEYLVSLYNYILRNNMHNLKRNYLLQVMYCIVKEICKVSQTAGW